MSAALKPGSVFAGRYRIEKFLARGGFGAVYEAEQVETGARVALKVLATQLLDSEDALDAFKREARISNRVDSDHVVRVFDVGRDPESGTPFLAMELLRGRHLDEMVREHGALPASDVLAYFDQIGSALDRAHNHVDREGVSRPIVHRDLKPENLFVTRRDDGSPFVKVIDFGLAKVLSESMKISHDLKGTPLFMAFEQVTAGSVTPQTDIWALGLIAFFLLTGRVYWLSASEDEKQFARVFSEILSRPIVPPSERVRSLGAAFEPSPEFDAWFARCVNRDPLERFGSASACIAELRRVLSTVDGVTSTEPPVHVAGPTPTASLPADSIATATVVPADNPASLDATSLERSRLTVPMQGSARRSVMGALLAGAALVVGAIYFGRSGAKSPSPPSPVRALARSAAASNPVPSLPILDASTLPSVDREPSTRGGPTSSSASRRTRDKARARAAGPAASVPDVYGER